MHWNSVLSWKIIPSEKYNHKWVTHEMYYAADHNKSINIQSLQLLITHLHASKNVLNVLYNCCYFILAAYNVQI